jgi:hypothetical protein
MSGNAAAQRRGGAAGAGAGDEPASYPLAVGRYEPAIEADQEGAPEPADFGPGSDGDNPQVFDVEAYQALEMQTVYDAVDSTKLLAGQCALQRALASPHRDVEAIRARQEALSEIHESPPLRELFETLIEQSAKHESQLYDLIWSDFVGLMSFESAEGRPRGGFGYEAFKCTRVFFNGMFSCGESPPAVKSSLLRSLLDDFGRLGDSRFYKLLTKGLFTEDGPVTREERPWYIPFYRFRPTTFKPGLLLTLAGLMWFGSQYYSYAFGVSATASLPFVGIFLYFAIIPLVALYVGVVGSSERDGFMKPVGRALLDDQLAKRAVDALGEIDLLLALLRYRDNFPTIMCMPDIMDTSHHQLAMRGVRNPIVTIDNPDYTPNDVVLDKARLSFVTGPNSGGKTALCKTVLQCQALAQAGSFVPATEASFSPADRVFYQVPQPGYLDRAEGRFATELSRTRDIFFGCTPMSLVVLDEPFEGTSFKERLTVSKQVLDGFIRLGSTVLFITHNHELAKTYRKARSVKAQFLMTKFVGDEPTYTFNKGIASHSHAEFVAKEIGFSKEDIDRRFENQE